MKLGRLLLLAGAAVAANAWMNKTEKGRQVKKDLSDNANRLTERVKDTVSRYTNGRQSGTDDLLSSGPEGSSNTGSPM